jgi:uncharacterized protein YlxW (UPF0749 family)
MATAPVTPAPAPLSDGKLKQDWSWLKTHIILLALMAALIFAGVWGIESRIEKVRAADDARLQNQVVTDKAQVTQVQQQIAQVQAAADADRAASAQIIATMTAQNAALSKAITARDQQTQTQQASDMHATIPILAPRLEALVPNVNPQDIVVSPDQKSVSVGTDTAQKVTAQLELVPQLQQDLSDTKQQVTNDTAQIASLQTFNQALTAEVTTDGKLNTLQTQELADSAKACTAQVNLEKAKNKKSFLRGFLWGGITGFVGGVILGHGI